MIKPDKKSGILTLLVITVAVLISGCVQEKPAGETPTPGLTSLPTATQTDIRPLFPPPSTPLIQEPADPGSDIQFVLNDTYIVGQGIDVKIKNTGKVSYTFNPYYEACYISYTDSSGRPFLIPPGTHCDIVATEEIKPGEIKSLFRWNLDECIEDRWGCARSRPLPAGTYTLKGKFHTKDSSAQTVTEKIIKVIE